MITHLELAFHSLVPDKTRIDKVIYVQISDLTISIIRIACFNRLHKQKNPIIMTRCTKLSGFECGERGIRTLGTPYEDTTS